MVKIFITGATGYIGGQVVDALFKAYPATHISVTALIRSQSSADILKKLYPSLNVVIGGLDDAELVEDAAANADIVIDTADADHIGAIKAITRGLERRGISHSVPGFFIHTSGVAILFESPSGDASERIYDDVADVELLTNMPDTAWHSIPDKLVFSASASIRTAIISPGTVYGLGASPLHPLGMAIPWHATAARQAGQAIVVSRGANILSTVHVQDLADLYVLLVGKAVAELDSASSTSSTSGTSSTRGTSSTSSSETEIFGPRAYYFGTSADPTALDKANLHAKALVQLGVIGSTEVKSVSLEEGNELGGPYFGIATATNARAKSTRARTVLGWEPTRNISEQGIKEEFEALLKKDKKQGAGLLYVVGDVH